MFYVYSHIIVAAQRPHPPIDEGPEQGFITSAGLSTAMASAVPRAMRRSGGMNRWTLEPLFSVVYILLLATGVLAVTLAAAGLDAMLVAVTVILLWAAAALVWARRRAARHAP